MARLDIDTGTDGNSATGDTLRTAFTKANTNFIELYSSIGSDNVVINTNTITTNLTNGNIQILPNGTGNIEVDALQVADTTITPLTTNADLTLATNGTGGIVIDNITIKDNTIKTTSSNENLEIKVAGTGSVVFDAVSITDNKILANRSNDNLQLDATGTGAIEMIPAIIRMANLPTSDPSSAGQLWNDSGDLKVSAG